MANPRPTAADTGDVADIPLARPQDLALSVPLEEAPGADEVGRAALSVAVDGELTPDGKFRWSAGWNAWVPTGKGEEVDLPGPLEWGPLMPDRPHRRGCWCQACWQAGLEYGDYLKAKAVRERNGFY